MMDVEQAMKEVQSAETLPLESVAGRVWAGTKYEYPTLSRLMNAARTLAAEVRRLRGVCDDYERQIRDQRLADEESKDAGMEPQAWIVNCPIGHKYDVLLCPTHGEAQVQAELFNDDLPENEPAYFPIPLYTREAARRAT